MVSSLHILQTQINIVNAHLVELKADNNSSSKQIEDCNGLLASLMKEYNLALNKKHSLSSTKLLDDVAARLEFGRMKYGHGVRIDDDMSDYTRSQKNSFLDMGLEEVLDGIVYIVAQYLRWLKYRYNIQYHYEYDEYDDNENILTIIEHGIHFPDTVSCKFKVILNNFIKNYNEVVTLQNELSHLDNMY